VSTAASFIIIIIIIIFVLRPFSMLARVGRLLPSLALSPSDRSGDHFEDFLEHNFLV
jgi:hypothetical protein